MSTSGRARRVLVIDDHQDSLEMLAEFLRLEGCEVHIAMDGPRGLELAGSHELDLILCDLSLPRMDGFEIAGHLRELPARAQLRLIAFTGHADPASIERARAAGFDAVVTKPIDPEALTRLLDPEPDQR